MSKFTPGSIKSQYNKKNFLRIASRTSNVRRQTTCNPKPPIPSKFVPLIFEY